MGHRQGGMYCNGYCRNIGNNCVVYSDDCENCGDRILFTVQLHFGFTEKIPIAIYL